MGLAVITSGTLLPFPKFNPMSAIIPNPSKNGRYFKQNQVGPLENGFTCFAEDHRGYLELQIVSRKELGAL